MKNKHVIKTTIIYYSGLILLSFLLIWFTWYGFNPEISYLEKGTFGIAFLWTTGLYFVIGFDIYQYLKQKALRTKFK